MKAVLLSARTGDITVLDVPPPVLRPGFVLIRNEYSLISAGTERATVTTGSQSLLGKARARPDQARQVLGNIKQNGLAETVHLVKDRLDRPMTLGYSCAGVVQHAGAGVDILPGTRVAAGGQGYASHAEVVCVPKNLVATIPDDVESRWAAFATVGAIALQGIHQADVPSGSCVVVIGLGLVGQLTVRLLRAYGYEAVGVDRSESVLDITRATGVPAFARDDPSLEIRLRRAMGGRLADAVLITAASKTPDPVQLAGRLARDRASVVIVGDVNVAPPRAEYYHKELSIRYSRSYGPGRYDLDYEEGGSDYPPGYVPWTEQRNISEVVRLLSQKRLDLDSLTPLELPVEEAGKAYDALRSEAPNRPLALLLRYQPATQVEIVPASTADACTIVRRWRAPEGRLRVAAIGAGNFANRMLFPHLKTADAVNFAWVATSGGVSAAHQAERWGFARAIPDASSGLAGDDADCVMVLSRHDSHARYTCAALRRGLGVFCEKPVGLSEEELEDVAGAWLSSGAPAMAGFNRRFAPAVRDLKSAMPTDVPAQVIYRVFAGRLPADHWYFDPAQGGRLLGEVCHFVDAAGFLLAHTRPQSVTCTGVDTVDGNRAQSLTVTVTYADASTASVVYGGSTPPGAPKEMVEVAGEGFAARLDDFATLTTWSGRRRRTRYRGASKGHAEEMAALSRVMHGEAVPTADFVLALQSSLVTCRALRAIREGTSVGVAADSAALQQALNRSSAT